MAPASAGKARATGLRKAFRDVDLPNSLIPPWRRPTTPTPCTDDGSNLTLHGALQIAGHTNIAAGIRTVGRNINRALELLGL
jgi:hypothetical protein